MLNKLCKFFLLTVILLTPVFVFAQQGGLTFYVYDDNGRLRSVITPTGDAVVYEYDAAGNFTAIRKLTANELEILAFTPRQGAVGSRVTIYGTGFQNGINSVSFNGVDAQIISTTPASAIAEVPVGATTGPFTVVTPNGSTSTAIPFTVKGVSILPKTKTVMANETVQFQTTVSGLSSEELTWSINGVNGGNTSVGTININGLYTAPNLVNSPALQFFVRATSVKDPSLFSEAIITVVSLGEGYQFRTNGVSVRYGTPTKNPPTFVDGSVSVRYGTPINNPPTFVEGAVSVRYGTPVNNPPTFVNGSVSVRYGTPINSPPTYINGVVSVTKGPVLTSLSSATITRSGNTNLTINGAVLNGASDVKFHRLDNSNFESGITATNINVNALGTSLTANITVNGSVTLGRYLVVITTPAGTTRLSSIKSTFIKKAMKHSCL